jgi:hypothetical protein
MDRCLGGTKSQPCTNESKYYIYWVIEGFDLCAKHYDEEDNAIKLREQIALEIEAHQWEVSGNSPSEMVQETLAKCLEIVRGNK